MVPESVSTETDVVRDDDLPKLIVAVDSIAVKTTIALLAEIADVLQLLTRDTSPMVHVSKAAGFATATETRTSYQCFHAQLP
jgi:hypothetical protein